MSTNENPLGTRPVNSLLKEFAIPSIIAMLVSSLYNVVDQFFIGRAIGELGNAATNVVYPLVPCSIAIALLFGIGGAASFNLAMGMGRTDKAKYYIGNAATMMWIIGIIVGVLCEIFCTPMLEFFGAPDAVMDYATVYMRICAIGFPFQVVAAGYAHLVRSDGAPSFSMKMNLTGAIINIVLDALFIFGFGWGMAGAAAATVIGQVVSALMGVAYVARFKTVTINREAYIPNREDCLRIMNLGAANFLNQMAMMLLAIVLNKSLSHYGALSSYGDSIPLAISGISLKCMQIMMAFVIGLSQGLQPIASFNYGAKKYTRVKEGVMRTLAAGAVICVVFYLLFELFPGQLIALFGEGSEEYFEFGIIYIRIYYIFMFTYFVQPIVSNFFSTIGKPKMGIFLSLTRQVIFYLPLLLVVPLFFGLYGILYAQAATDLLACLVNIYMFYREMRRPEYAADYAGA
ncbi:MAG: MATE family efflux transporter [Eubacterium sp.]|nr:MATE family efflux transporter [Eubacterium sp.]